jgi:ethanolamine utilization microcompartment shell protein EutS
MNAATKRSIIAAAGLATIGLAAWPQQATQLAQERIPTVHRDVVLVDDGSVILPPETSLDTELFNSVLGPTGAEEQMYTALVDSVGATEAQTLLDTGGASPVFSGVFNGAESRAFEGLYINTLVSEDELNQALGVTQDNSQTAILADLLTNPGPPIPGSTDITVGDLTTAVGTPAFDTDLASIANADYALALSDVEGYLGSFAGDLGSLGDLGGLGDLGSLGTDLTAILDGLTGLL